MWRRLLGILVCPACGGDLTLSADAGVAKDDWIEEGTLACGKCTQEYAVQDGVPVMLTTKVKSSAKQAPRKWSFDFQWRQRFAGNLEQGSLLWGIDLSQVLPAYRLKFADCWYLDCGSGSGDHTRNIALQNPTVQTVGLDFSNSVFAAAARDRAIGNLHYVQADLLRPPFRAESFKVLVAIGSWHATGNTRQALLNSARLVQSGGFLAAWLYPNLGDLRNSTAKRQYRMWRRYYFFRDKLFLGKAHHLAPRLLLPLCKAVSLIISPFGHIAGFDVPRFQDRYRSNTFILLDDISPTHQDRPAKVEVFEWFQEAGVNRVVHSLRRGGVFLAVKA